MQQSIQKTSLMLRQIKLLGKKILLLDVLLSVVSFCLPFIVHWRLLTPNLLDRLYIYQDVTTSIFPALVHISEVVKLGDMPLWNWHVYSGMYEGGAFYNHLLYPLTLPFSLGWLAPSDPAVFHAYLILHLGIGAVGMYWLARSLKFKPYLSLMGVCIYVFCYYASYSIMAGGAFLIPLAWLPYALIAWRSFALKKSPRYALIAGLLWFFCLLSANPIIIVPLIPFVLFWLFIWGKEGFLRGHNKLHYLGWLGLSFVISGGMWLGQAIPLWESISVSSRNANYIYEWASLSWKGKKEFFTLIRSILLPFYGGGPLSVASLGAVGTILFVIGIWLAKQGWERSLAWFTLIMAAVLFLPGSLMLYDIAYLLFPLVGRINAMDRGALAYLLPAILIALAGVRCLMQGRHSIKLLTTFYPAMFSFLIYGLVYGIGAGYFNYYSMGQEKFTALVFHMGIFTIATFVFIRQMLNHSTTANAGKYLFALFVITLLDGSAFTRDQLAGMYMNAETMRTSGVHSYIGQHHKLNVGQPTLDQARVYEPRNQQAMMRSAYNVVGYYQFQPYWVAQAIISSNFKDDYLRRNHNSFNMKLKWSRLNVERLYDLNTDNRKGRAFPVMTGVAVPNSDLSLQVVAEKDFDPSKKVVYEKWDTAIKAYPELVQLLYKSFQDDSVPEVSQLAKPIKINETTEMLSQTTNSVRFKVDSKAGFFFFSNSWYPGWVAFVNGQKVPVSRADYAFMSIELPDKKKSNIVDFVFRPVPYFIGLFFTGLFSIVWLLLFVFNKYLLRVKI